MYTTFLGVPWSICEELEQAFHLEGLAIESRHLPLHSPTGLPQIFPPGLVVVWDDGGELERMVEDCRRLSSLCSLSRTCLVVLTEREPAEREALVLAGASECVSPTVGQWSPGVLVLARRMGLPSRSGTARGVPENSRVPMERALQTLLAATTADLGHDFFRTLVKQLAEAFRVTCAMVGELNAEREAIQTLAFWSHGRFQRDVNYPLVGTPCHNAVVCSICHYADDVSRHFPEDLMLMDLGLRGYLGAALRSAKGEVIGVLAILHDQPLEAGELDFALLSAFAARAGAELERIRAHAELERTRDFLRNTLDAVPDPLVVKDRSHRWVAMNSAFCRFMGGRDAQELLGKTITDCLPVPEAELFRELDEQAFISGQGDETEHRFIDTVGLERTIATRRAVFPGADGQPSLVTIIRDLTERKRLEMQLRLADRMASMGTLAAGVAHEINNPLAYVCSNLTFLGEQLAQESIPPEVLPELREVVAETQDGARRVRSIIQDLKTFSRADEELLGPIDIHQVIDRALRLVRNELQGQTRLERILDPIPQVRGNEARLGQVLVNLLVNALQALPERSWEQNLIRITTRCDGAKRVRVEVEDNGSGMSPEVQQRIFDPFFTTKEVGIGTGLGLSICHTIIQSMDGEIEVRSDLGRGTSFVLLLPAFEAAVEEQSEEADAPEPLRSIG